LITRDNVYEVQLNGISLGSDNVYGDWKPSNLKQAYVDIDGWQRVGSYALQPYLKQGINSLTIDTADEYLDDYGHPYTGTPSNNPVAIIFSMEVIYCVEEETAWADGNDIPGRNWATYFTYLVQ